MITQEKTENDALLQEYPDQRSGLERIFKNIAKLPLEDQAIIRRAMGRYIAEAVKNSYQAEPGVLAKLIADRNLVEGTELVDLGAGAGNLLSELASMYPDMRVRGMDLSPGFVANFNRKNQLANARMDVGLIDSAFTNIDLDAQNNASAVSVLTLDRLAYPQVLIENMARFNRAKVLATLLPVVPEDDNPSRQDKGKKIVYTREENRIVPGKTAEEDREVLLRVLERSWGREVRVENVDYTVQSSGDRQTYDLAVFYTQ